MEQIRLPLGSLYSDAQVIRIQGDTPQLSRIELDWQGNIDDRVYTVRIGDTLMSIADAEYRAIKGNDAKQYFWLIADANKQISNPLELSDFVGKEIVIPNISFYEIIR